MACTLQGFYCRIAKNRAVAIFNIPKDARDGFALLRDIPDDAFNQLLLAIENEESDLDSLKALSSLEVEQITDSVHTASFVRVSADVPLEEFVDDLVQSLRHLEEGFFNATNEKRFRERATRVLGSESVVVTAKALTLQNEHERQFCRARIFTDARPVYADDPSSPPSAMVITHTLKIEYHGVGGHLHEIYLGISANGISNLTNVLDRAAQKAKSLETALEGTNLVLIDPKSDKEN